MKASERPMERPRVAFVGRPLGGIGRSVGAADEVSVADVAEIVVGEAGKDAVDEMNEDVVVRRMLDLDVVGSLELVEDGGSDDDTGVEDDGTDERAELTDVLVKRTVLVEAIRSGDDVAV
ncbi:hypothetical protein N0V90_013107 [Kalmusia sp. IMI 367209]|nr:hypothetical protein N0V90_013107 [Kalmusia sp. IMI 367209]